MGYVYRLFILVLKRDLSYLQQQFHHSQQHASPFTIYDISLFLITTYSHYVDKLSSSPVCAQGRRKLRPRWLDNFSNTQDQHRYYRTQICPGTLSSAQGRDVSRRDAHLHRRHHSPHPRHRTSRQASRSYYIFSARTKVKAFSSSGCQDRFTK